MLDHGWTTATAPRLRPPGRQTLGISVLSKFLMGELVATDWLHWASRVQTQGSPLFWYLNYAQVEARSWHLRQRFDLDFAFHGSDSDLSFASRC
jgi:hypothetical protein